MFKAAHYPLFWVIVCDSGRLVNSFGCSITFSQCEIARRSHVVSRPGCEYAGILNCRIGSRPITNRHTPHGVFTPRRRQS